MRNQLQGECAHRTILGLTALALAASSLAQSTYGTFVGTVHDPSGAVIAHATVQITNKGTSAQRSVATDAAGFYTFVNVDPGVYM